MLKTHLASERNGNLLQPTYFHHQIVDLTPAEADLQRKSTGQDILVYPVSDME